MRRNGILMHISSLPSDYGIGSLGMPAFKFVDFLYEAGQSLWQVLPTNPTSFGDSPYQSFSVFAGNPYFIDLEILHRQGLLTEDELEACKYRENYEAVDYAWVYKNRRNVMTAVYTRFDTKDKDYIGFCKQNAEWLCDYALFMALKDAHGGVAWYEWQSEYKTRDARAIKDFCDGHREAIELYKMQQYLFSCQWTELKKYANEKGIRLIGDMPIYTAHDSSDVWANPHLFKLDAELSPTHVAGCPPDAFSDDGQRWGNPIYNWKLMKEDGYSWFCRRMKKMCESFDTVRIDHFRGFAEYYEIPASEQTARHGKWVKGPGKALFDAIRERCGECDIIAEDLGFMTPSVKKLLHSCGFPGIKVLEFAFSTNEESEYMPHNYERNCVVYTGTHDNSTVLGWLNGEASEAEVDFAKRYMRLNEQEGYNWGMIKCAMASPADTCILQMQDLLGLDDRARMNTPSTLGGNWTWRVKEECINFWLAGILKKLSETYWRANKDI